MLRTAFLFLLLPSVAFAYEGVRVSNAWAPPSLNQQNGVGFLTLEASQDDALIGIESDCCKVIEIHKMTLKNDVMRMRRVESVPLPDHEKVRLISGGYHLMLIGLNEPLEVGGAVPLTLNFEHAKPVDVTLDVKKRSTSTQTEPAHEHHGHH